MIEKFEQMVDRYKRKINPKILSVSAFFIFGFTLLYALIMSNNFKREKDLVQNEYNRSMYELIGYTKNVDIQFKKLQITVDSSLMTTTLADIWRQSNLAKENLANLPISQDTLANTSKYLSQVSDYSYYLMKKTSYGEKINQEEYDQMQVLSESAAKLVSITTQIYDDLINGRLKWDEVEKVGTEKLEQNVTVANIQNISKTFQDYEGLIYDGAFSEHITSLKPRMLYEGENLLASITEQQGIEKIKSIFGEVDVVFTGENTNKIDLLEYTINGNRAVSLTKNGGLLYSMLYNREVAENVITDMEAVKKGIEFLHKLGIKDITDTYYVINDNMITINYAFVEKDVILYPDLIKIKIALDNGEICSYEGMGYIFNHHQRDNLTPTASIEAARSKLRDKIEIQSEKVALILTDSKKEVLTYEFKGKIGDVECLVYVNAATLKEEKIFMMITSRNGTVTI